MIDWFKNGLYLFELDVLIRDKYSDDEELKQYRHAIKNAARLCYCISFLKRQITDVKEEIESI